MSENTNAAGRGKSVSGGPSIAAMRKPSKRRSTATSRSHRTRSAVTTPNYLWLAANRMAFGASPYLYNEWLKMPGSGEEKFDNYVEQQLAPYSPPGGIPAVDDSLLSAELTAAGFSFLQLNIPSLWNNLHENRPSGVNRRDGIEEVELATWMRRVYGRAQLHEVLADFWHDHFNCWGWDYWSQPVWPSYDRVIRTFMLGNFREFLINVARHPAMLYYLDQYTSTDFGPNENYARELFELHTMGAEHYFGVIPKSAVPTDGTGLPLGYVDEDVYETARCLSGWTVNNGSSSSNNGQDDGTFYFNLSLHDKGLKRVLDLEMPAGTRGVQDGIDVLDALARHPATGKHVARRLCRRLVSDDPPQSLVDAAASEFTNYWQATDQLERVVRLILKSTEFKTTRGEKAKRPFEIVASAMRAVPQSWQFYDGQDDLSSLFWRFDATGHPLFSWPGPDGFPDERSKWESSTPKVMCWRLVNWMTEIKKPNSVHRMDVVAQTPPHIQTAIEFSDFWISRILAGGSMTAEDRDIIIDFAAGGTNPNQSLSYGNSDTASRLRSTVALILNSPYNHER